MTQVIEGMQIISCALALLGFGLYILLSIFLNYLSIPFGNVTFNAMLMSVVLGAGACVGACVSQKFSCEDSKKYLFGLIQWFILGCLIILFNQYNLMFSVPSLVLAVALLLAVQGFLLGLFSAFEKNYLKPIVLGFLVAVVFQEKALEGLGYPGILLCVGALYLAIAASLGLFREAISINVIKIALEKEWSSPFWFWIAVAVQCLTVGYFLSGERLAVVLLSDSPVIMNAYQLMAFFNFSVGLWWYFKQSQECQADPKSLTKGFNCFSIFLFVTLIFHKEIFSVPALFHYTSEITSFHKFVFMTLISCFLFTLPMCGLGFLWGGLSNIGGARLSLGLVIGVSVGALLFGKLMMPAIGMVFTLETMIYLSLFVTFAIYLKFKNIFQGVKKSIYVMMALYVAMPMILWKQNEHINLYSFETLKIMPALKKEQSHYKKMVAHQNDSENTLEIIDNVKNGHKVVLNNGQVVSGWDHNEALVSDTAPILAVALSYFYQPNLKNCLVLGLNQGLLSEALLQLPSIQKVTTVESSAHVLALIKNFSPYNMPFKSDKSEILSENYRRYLSSDSSHKYDAIFLNGPSLSKTNASQFYTKEFYAQIKDRLPEKGLYVQSINLMETSHELLATILKTLRVVFPYTKTYFANNQELLILSSVLPFSKDSGESLFRDKNIAKLLDKIGVKSMNDLKIRFFLDDETGIEPLYIKTYSDGGRQENILFDRFPYLERDAFAYKIAFEKPDYLSLKWGSLPSITKILNAEDASVEFPIQYTPLFSITANYNIAYALYQMYKGSKERWSIQADQILMPQDNKLACGDKRLKEQWLEKYLQLMSVTVPYLNVEQMTFILDAVKYPCAHLSKDKVDERVRRWMSLYKDAMKKNYQQMAPNAEKLMYMEEDRSVGQQIAMYYLVLAQTHLKQVNHDFFYHYHQPSLHIIENYNRRVMGQKE